MPRATLRLSLRCNNLCVFCAQDGLEEPGERDACAQLERLRAEADEVTLTGGEPTISPDLVGTIEHARSLGFTRVGIQTNGRKLAAPGVAETLALAGLTDMHVSLHGADAAAHDYHTGVAGSFAELRAGITRARTEGIVVVATTVLTRSNFRVLAGMPALLTMLGVAAWAISIPRSAGRAAVAFDRIQPRLGLALPFALHALELADRSGLPAWMHGAPLCALGPFGDRTLPEPSRAYDVRCDECRARSLCSGIDAHYLERFGPDELDPERIVGRPDRREDALARMFVGVGELATSAPASTHAPPKRARASLPVLGRVQPGRDELRPSATKQSGEALQELFPDLFDGDES